MKYTTNAAHAPVERRQDPRKDVDIAALARFKDGSTRPCRIKNISAMGALLEFENDDPMPLSFRIAIASEMFSAECERRHQTANRTGVLFMTGRAEALARFG